MDRYLQGKLKNWASRRQPPAELRSHLLLLAVNDPNSRLEPSFHYYENRRPAHLDFQPQVSSNRLQSIDWLLLFQSPMPALRMI